MYQIIAGKRRDPDDYVSLCYIEVSKKEAEKFALMLKMRFEFPSLYIDLQKVPKRVITVGKNAYNIVFVPHDEIISDTVNLDNLSERIQLNIDYALTMK